MKHEMRFSTHLIINNNAIFLFFVFSCCFFYFSCLFCFVFVRGARKKTVFNGLAPCVCMCMSLGVECVRSLIFFFILRVMVISLAPLSFLLINIFSSFFFYRLGVVSGV